MSSLNLSQRLWQIADEKVQRALDGLASIYDSALRTLNKSFDFTDAVTTVRNGLTVLGSTNAQNVAATGISTPGGFKSVVGPWQRSQSTFSTTATALVWGADSAATSSAGLAQGFYPTHSGSVIGMQLAGTAGTATTISTTLYKNGLPTLVTASLALTTGTTFTQAAFPKGAVAFAPGDRLDVYYSASAANTGQLVSSFTMEMAA